MDVERLRHSPIGQLVPIQGRDARYGDFAYFAYLPDRLPDDLVLESVTWAAVAEASMALGKLDQVCAQLPDPRLLIRPALWREALDTSALEGTVGLLRDLLEAQLSSVQYLSPETKEINSYVEVALTAFNMIRDRAISVGFLSELQERLFRESPEKPQHVGHPRQDLVWIGDKKRPIEEARFVPPPADDRLKSGLDSWVDWVQAEHAHLAPIVRAALAHYQFETLHPFGDGNGRLGRLVVVLQLLRSDTIQQPAITLSPWLLRNRSEYQDQLLAVSCTGNWNPWVRFFCSAISAQCFSLISGAERLLAWLTSSRKIVDDRHWTGAIHRVLAGLVEWPVTSVSDAASRYEISPMNATRIIQHLVEAGIVTELTGKSYGRIFGATEIINIVEAI
ncbi:MAG TPA: Fic family protein [Streptosporangiaceae bacterium]|nr:Fic family protein [Streptosporangiaceae bacterium]